MPQSSVPPSSQLVPRHSHGGPVYILAVVVLVCAIGAIICWKLKPAPTPPPAPVVTAAPTPRLAEPPPPPPPPVEQDAGVVENKTAPTPAAAKPCSNCAGTASSDLRTAVSRRAAAARPCYEKALRSNSALQGKLLVHVRVDSSGLVCSSNIAQDGIRSSEVSSCVLGMFRNSRFPAPTGGCVDINVPMSFMPKEGK